VVSVEDDIPCSGSTPRKHQLNAVASFRQCRHNRRQRRRILLRPQLGPDVQRSDDARRFAHRRHHRGAKCRRLPHEKVAEHGGFAHDTPRHHAGVYPGFSPAITTARSRRHRWRHDLGAARFNPNSLIAVQNEDPVCRNQFRTTTTRTRGKRRRKLVESKRERLLDVITSEAAFHACAFKRRRLQSPWRWSADGRGSGPHRHAVSARRTSLKISIPK